MPKPIFQDNYYLKEIGSNHQKGFQRNFDKQNGLSPMASVCEYDTEKEKEKRKSSTSQTQRSKISSVHDWRTEVNGSKTPKEKEIYDPKKMMQMQ